MKLKYYAVQRAIRKTKPIVGEVKFAYKKFIYKQTLHNFC